MRRHSSGPLYSPSWEAVSSSGNSNGAVSLRPRTALSSYISELLAKGDCRPKSAIELTPKKKRIY
jgi:hypothetical protein